MTKSYWRMTDEYAAALQDYLAGQGESCLERANELARKAIANGQGILDIAAAHRETLLRLGTVNSLLRESLEVARVTSDFETECFGPLEMVFRGYQEVSAALRRLNRDLGERVAEQTQELINAYDATLAGWVQALDLRDKETEGHSQRVTVMSVRLAQAMGVSQADLVHVRRGALLHDIGKMGVPDAILHKAGPLTDEEWVVMRRHPVDGFEFLESIEYLRPALDIPYCHHEKWDGNGYPRGLKAEAIPLAARIFAVADIYDALRSDRLYRPAWPEERVREHIGSLSGTHLDPQVAQLFLNLPS